VVKVKDKYDLMRFDSSGAVSTGMFDETWHNSDAVEIPQHKNGNAT
jgi:hypothetical protein